MRKILLSFVMISYIVVSCFENENNKCKIIPLPENRYVVSDAGTNDINGYYYIDNSGKVNNRLIYIKNEAYEKLCSIKYDLIYGWCIEYEETSNNILYYSNTHGDSPPDDIIINWQILNGLQPAPMVKKDIYFYPGLYNCGF